MLTLHRVRFATYARHEVSPFLFAYHVAWHKDSRFRYIENADRQVGTWNVYKDGEMIHQINGTFNDLQEYLTSTDNDTK